MPHRDKNIKTSLRHSEKLRFFYLDAAWTRLEKTSASHRDRVASIMTPVSHCKREQRVSGAEAVRAEQEQRGPIALSHR